MLRYTLFMDENKILEDYAAGISIKDIAAKYDLNYYKVYRLIKSYRENIIEHDYEQMIELIKEGYSVGKVSEHLNIPCGTISSVFERTMGISIREYRRKHPNRWRGKSIS